VDLKSLSSSVLEEEVVVEEDVPDEVEDTPERLLAAKLENKRVKRKETTKRVKKAKLFIVMNAGSPMEIPLEVYEAEKTFTLSSSNQPAVIPCLKKDKRNFGTS
jgi:hypothetical protein